MNIKHSRLYWHYQKTNRAEHGRFASSARDRNRHISLRKQQTITTM